MVVSLLLLVSCDLFTTRTPETPEGTGTNGWRFPESPRVAIDNLNSAMGRRSPSDYTRLFVATGVSQTEYSYQPDPGTASSNPGMFDGWGVTKEQQHSQSLFAPTNVPLDSLVLLTMRVERETSVGDTSNISIDYVLHVGHKIEDRPRDFEGRGEFRLIRVEDGGWYIVNWSDTRATGKACWSDLKALF